jgi:hypothetical protein
MLEIGWPTAKNEPSGFRMPAVLPVMLKIVPDPPCALSPGKRMVALV